MPQQLNLYTRSLCQSRQPNALGTLMLWQGALLAVGLAAGAALQWDTRAVRRDTRQLVAQTDERRASLLPAGAGAGTAANDKAQQVRAQLQRLRDREAAIQRLQGLLANGSAGRREGYADHLEALARRSHPAVWITGLTLHGHDDAIELRGRMTDPAVLPDYLRSLQAEPQFKGRSFATLQIQRGDADTDPNSLRLGIVSTLVPAFSEFTLSSQPPRSGDAPPARKP